MKDAVHSDTNVPASDLNEEARMKVQRKAKQTKESRKTSDRNVRVPDLEEGCFMFSFGCVEF
ncbi:hypothetical protein [Vibrio maerlii]|uniref:hypothetical protein n=1 Tax=Vibrio maerlii TaxID=2231648 RepID=UPI000E3BFEB1|nr:hypothetical protein [Vibrio maerlii]